MIRKTLFGLGTGMAMLLGATGPADAGVFSKPKIFAQPQFSFQPQFKFITVHEKVVVHEIRRVPVTEFVTVFENGKFVKVKKVFFKEVKVPVVKVIPVTKK